LGIGGLIIRIKRFWGKTIDERRLLGRMKIKKFLAGVSGMFHARNMVNLS
jgi:hypothetical protein